MKNKSRKSVTKRFKITAGGKVTRRVAFGRHIRSSKSKRQLRRYKQTVLVTGRIARRIKRLMAQA